MLAADQTTKGSAVASEHRVTAVTTVPATLERVWSIVSDLGHYEDWVESTMEVRPR